MPKWEPDLEFEPPAWLVEGTRVVHTTFGPGVVGRVGHYKDLPSVWVDFDNGDTKALALEIAVEYLDQEQTPTQSPRGLLRRLSGN